MPSGRFEPSMIKNKMKREETARKVKKAKRQAKLQKRLARAKEEENDPLAKKKRLALNIPKTLDNTRELDPSIPINQSINSPEIVNEAGPSSNSAKDGQQPFDESILDIASDPYASYFESAFACDPSIPPKVLITTSFKSSKLTYEFCDALVTVIPGSEFIRRRKGKGFEMGRIAVWAAERGYSNMIVVNEDMKRPNAMSLIHLPEGPSAYFKLSSVQLTKQIKGHAKATDHYPELVLNNFVTRLGHNVGRMFQTLFPPMPEFQGRQVVTLHNQRDFLFFRRHRYAFRSTEKAALQEIGPRFTLKLRWMRKGLPAVLALGNSSQPLEFAAEDGTDYADAGKSGLEQPDTSANLNCVAGDDDTTHEEAHGIVKIKIQPPTQDEYIWMWKPELESTRRTFFL